VEDAGDGDMDTGPVVEDDSSLASFHVAFADDACIVEVLHPHSQLPQTWD